MKFFYNIFLNKFLTLSIQNIPLKIFTLNQDLFLERLFLFNSNNFNDNNSLLIPIVGFPDIERYNEPYMCHKIPEKIDIENEKFKLSALSSRGNAPIYFKLHGSCNWFKKDMYLMVIGHGKDKFINNEPILKFYLNHFEEVLNEDEEKQLFIIGYSFQDEHINQIISKAKKTKLFILNTSPMKDFFDELETRIIWKKDN